MMRKKDRIQQVFLLGIGGFFLSALIFISLLSWLEKEGSTDSESVSSEGPFGELQAVINRGRTPSSIEESSFVKKQFPQEWSEVTLSQSLPLVDGQLSLPVVLSSVPRCEEGDLDIMRKDLERLKVSDRSLLFTIEPLLSEQAQEGTIHALPVSLKDISGGVRSELKFPQPPKLAHYAVYLCIDTKKEGKCSSKPLVDMKTLSFEVNSTVVIQPAADMVDKTYYFSHFILTPEGVSVLPGGLREENKEKFIGVLNKLGALSPSLVTKRIEELGKITSSIPLTIKSGGIFLDLPQHSMPLCGKVMD